MQAPPNDVGKVYGWAVKWYRQSGDNPCLLPLEKANECIQQVKPLHLLSRLERGIHEPLPDAVVQEKKLIEYGRIHGLFRLGWCSPRHIPIPSHVLLERYIPFLTIPQAEFLYEQRQSIFRFCPEWTDIESFECVEDEEYIVGICPNGAIDIDRRRQFTRRFTRRRRYTIV